MRLTRTLPDTGGGASRSYYRHGKISYLEEPRNCYRILYDMTSQKGQLTAASESNEEDYEQAGVKSQEHNLLPYETDALTLGLDIGI